MKYLLLIVACIILAGCSPDWTQKQNECITWADRYMGKTEHDLIMDLGNSRYLPETDGDGGKIVRYCTYAPSTYWTTWTGMFVKFYINSKGVVYHIRCSEQAIN